MDGASSVSRHLVVRVGGCCVGSDGCVCVDCVQFNGNNLPLLCVCVCVCVCVCLCTVEGERHLRDRGVLQVMGAVEACMTRCVCV